MKTKKKSAKSDRKLFITILQKDIKSEIRQANDIISIILFGIISIFIFSSSYNTINLGVRMPIEIFVIQIWLIIFFTLIFIMIKLFVQEKERGTLDGLTSSPVSNNILLISKVVFCFILLSFIELILLLFSFFISVPSVQILNFNEFLYYILIGIVLPTLDISICGTLVSALSMYSKNKSFVLPLLLFPIILPITSPIISLNIRLLEGELISMVVIEILFLVAHVILMFSILVLVSEELLSE
ncbi:MAG: heme exporter protein CcmB [Candidatus Lokiarchaeota archaeon]|nr:heme exporter protein CcmB [Candidatus Lokiarchaeota archaeon]